MDELEERILSLIEKRENLLRDKESNKLQIWICEQEIYTYAHLYDTLSGLMAIKRKNIESYLDIIDYKKNSITFTWPGLVPSYSHILPMIDDLQEEYNDMFLESEKAKELISLYDGKKQALMMQNEEIDEQITNIENELEANEHVKIKENNYGRHGN